MAAGVLALIAVTTPGCSDGGKVLTITTPATTLDHIIVVMMENRSFDHLLGWVPNADGRQAGLFYRNSDFILTPTHHLTSPNGCGLSDPDHTYAGGRSEYNDGALDGWLTTPGNDEHATGYYLADDLPFLGKAATQWTVLDRYFAPVMGPTFPNRIVSLAGQTDRLENTLPTALPTIWEKLKEKGITGRNYGDGLTSSSLWGARYLDLIRPMASFYSDAASGALPNVAFVDPDFLDDFSGSFHPPDDIRNGDAFLSRVYKAVTTSPAWNSSLLIIVFDEWGGFFDHVAPPPAPLPDIEKGLPNDGLRGFRVPALLVSPFVKRGFVSSAVYDHASVLKLIEARWGLNALTVRDSLANNLLDELDMMNPDLSAPSIDVAQGPFPVPCKPTG